MPATVWDDPEKLEHSKLAALVAEIQDEIAEFNQLGITDPESCLEMIENIAYLLRAAGLGPREVGAK